MLRGRRTRHARVPVPGTKRSTTTGSGAGKARWRDSGTRAGSGRRRPGPPSTTGCGPAARCGIAGTASWSACSGTTGSRTSSTGRGPRLPGQDRRDRRRDGPLEGAGGDPDARGVAEAHGRQGRPCPAGAGAGAGGSAEPRLRRDRLPADAAGGPRHDGAHRPGDGPPRLDAPLGSGRRRRHGVRSRRGAREGSPPDMAALARVQRPHGRRRHHPRRRQQPGEPRPGETIPPGLARPPRRGAEAHGEERAPDPRARTRKLAAERHGHLLDTRRSRRRRHRDGDPAGRPARDPRRRPRDPGAAPPRAQSRRGARPWHAGRRRRHRP